MFRFQPVRAATLVAFAILGFTVGCGIRSGGGFTVKMGNTPAAAAITREQPARANEAPVELQDALITAHGVMRGHFRRLQSIRPDFERYYFDEWGDSTLDVKYMPRDSQLAVILTMSWYATEEERGEWKRLLDELRSRFGEKYGKERLGPLPWHY